MIKVEMLGGLLTLALFLWCTVEVIQTPEDQIRNLAKLHWLLLVFFLPLVGSVAWLVAGRPQKPRHNPYERRVPEFPGYDRPGRAAAANPEDDEKFLRSLRDRAEEQRRRADEERRKRDEDDGRQ